MTTPTKDPWADLELLLGQLIDRHRELLDCLASKQEAIRSAQVDQLEPLCAREREVAIRINELDRRRQILSVQILGLPKDSKPALGQLLDSAPGSVKERVRAAANSLRALVLEVKRRSTVVRQAAEALSAHLSGLMQTIHAAISSARVYGRRGRILTPSVEMSAVDIRS